MTLPIVIAKSGAVPRFVGDVRADLLARVTAVNPGYTANLPGSLIEDISSTDVAAIALSEQAFVDLINSLTPYGANDFLLSQFGKMQGIQAAIATKTTVYITFSGKAGYVVNKGFIVGDGVHSFMAVQTGVVGSSTPILFQSITSDSFAVPAGSVTLIRTVVDKSFNLTCINLLAGVAAQSAQTSDSFRVQVLQANRASAVGQPTFIKTAIARVLNVPARGVGVKQIVGSGWQILVIGGNQFDVAAAIFNSCSDVSRLIGSTIDSSRTADVTIYDDPDTYLIRYVQSPSQAVGIQISWATILNNFAGRDAVGTIVKQPIADYINSINVGQPINVLEIERTFQDAAAPILAPRNIIKLVIAVAINGVPVLPSNGTSIISGDPESYFATDINGADVIVGQN